MTTPLRVLILEDSPTDAEVMVHHLREAGYSPEWRRVETEADFCAHLESTLDLILADYTLPEFTARQALHLLRERAPDIPAIVITGTVSEEIALECLRLGASDYLLKDRLARLGEAVRSALAQRTLRRERATAEAARHESEARARFLADVLERSSQAFAVGHPDGRMDICNAAFCTLVGHTEAELRALDWSRALTPPEWQAVEAERLAELRRTGRPVRYEKEYLRKDGTRVPVELLVHLVQEGAEASPYYFAFVTDLTDRKRAEQDLATRTRQLEAVRAVSDEIARELDLARVLELISRRAADLVGRGAVTVFLWEEPAQLLVQRAWSGAEESALARLTIRLGEDLAGQVAERRQGMMVNDYQAWPFAHSQVLEWSNVSAALAEPLLYRGGLVGVILLDNRDTGRTFTENDRELLRLFAAPAAIAIENARLHSAAVTQGAKLDALLRATRSVMSGLDLQAILTRIAAAAADIAGTPHVKVILLDKEAEQLRIGALEGMTASGFPLPLDRGLSGLVATAGEPVFSPDCAHDPRNVMAERDRELGIVTYLGLPIKSRGEVVGILTFNTTEPREYSPEELAYLTSFADQAAIAIENARLYEAAQRELKERTRTAAALRSHAEHLEAIRSISEEITRELSLPGVLDLIIRRAIELLGAVSGTVSLWDEAAKELVPHAWTGLGNWRKGLHLRLGEGVVGRVAQERQGMIVNQFRASPLAHPVYLERTATAAILAEPLLYRDRLVGVIDVDRDAAGGPFTPEDRETLRLFAAQAAVAIENARLFAELNHSYRALQETQDELIRSEKLRALGQMAAGVAHDLNNMLAVILGQAQLLRILAAHPKVEETLTPLETAASDCAAIVRRLQDFARQRSRSTLTPVPLDALVREALEITRPRWRDEPQRHGLLIQVRTDLADLPPILANAPEIREALTNLILNATDAMPHGGTLTIRGASVGGWVDLSVTDTGIGMSPEVRGKIFEPFFTTKGGRGTGLGLSVTYAILERHGGSIQVQSSPGHGTTFTLRFQVAPADVGETPVPAQARPSPRRLLVIDDDAGVRATLVGLLRASGHLVSEADGGAAGLAQLAAGRPDVVITDLGMPEITGWDVARAVKARSPSLPVLLLTGWGEGITTDGPEAGAVDRILAKPVRLNDLLQAIEDLSARAGTGQPPSAHPDAS